MSSSQHVLGLPIGLLDMGLHLLIFWTLLSSAMRSTWPNQKFKRHKIKDYSDMFRIVYDPKHVGVIFNFVFFILLYNVDFNL